MLTKSPRFKEWYKLGVGVARKKKKKKRTEERFLLLLKPPSLIFSGATFLAFTFFFS